MVEYLQQQMATSVEQADIRVYTDVCIRMSPRAWCCNCCCCLLLPGCRGAALNSQTQKVAARVCCTVTNTLGGSPVAR